VVEGTNDMDYNGYTKRDVKKKRNKREKNYVKERERVWEKRKKKSDDDLLNPQLRATSLLLLAHM
jgi:hypothetical protein